MNYRNKAMFTLFQKQKKPLQKINYPPVKKVFLFTNARNEKHIEEWATHHLSIGFDFICIFDHKSDQPIQPFDDARVKVIRCEMNNPVKMFLMNEAIKIARLNKADWFIYLDADEFIILNQFANIKEMLNRFKHAHSLCLNWLMFGTSGHIKEPPGLIMDNYTRSALMLDQHVKTFVRTGEVIQSGNPHFYDIRNPSKSRNLKNQVVSGPFNPNMGKYTDAPAYIAHYIYQSEETYINRKIKLPRDDIGSLRERNHNIHNEFNDVENCRGVGQKF